MKLIITLVATTLLMSPVPTLSQTVLSSGAQPVKPGLEAAPATPDTDAAQAGRDAQLLPASVAVDAIAQRHGVYPPLDQPGNLVALQLEGGMIQHAWNSAPPTAGIAEFRMCRSCVYRVRTRELMVSTVILPEGVFIERADLGDPAGFNVEVRTENMLAVKPESYGIDTNLNVYTDVGVFSFYLRAEGFNSTNIPDLVVRIEDPTGIASLAAPKRQAPAATSAAPTPEIDATDISAIAPADATNAASLTGGPAGPRPAVLQRLAPTHDEADFVERVEFDPGKLHGFDDYTLWGDRELRPETVFRDAHFTYIQFGAKWNTVELPVAFVVVDEIDEQVNTRIQGRTYIVESVAEVITLKSGIKYLCIRYDGAPT